MNSADLSGWGLRRLTLGAIRESTKGENYEAQSGGWMPETLHGLSILIRREGGREDRM